MITYHENQVPWGSPMRKKKQTDAGEIILRSCNADGTSYGGFRWPLEVGAIVRAPDWDPKPGCGNGLHGLRSGQNYLRDWYEGLVQFVRAYNVVDLGGKVKFEWCEVLFVGSSADAWAWAHLNAPGCWCRGTATAGYKGTATAGDLGTATAGYGGTATAGNGGTATAGYGGTATAGNGGTATAGNGGTLCVKWWDGMRYRLAVAYVGEDGIEPNTPYKIEVVDGKPEWRVAR